MKRLSQALPLLLVALAALLAGCPPRHDYPDGLGLQGQLEREVVALQQTVRSLERAVETCGEEGEPDSLYTDLYQVFKGTEVTLERKGLSTILTVPADHVFSRGTDMRAEATMTLDLIATALNLHPDYTVTIEGHTDDSAPTGDLRRLYGTNWELSYARAEAVMHKLVVDYGVAEHRFTLAARGPYSPVATNDTHSGQAKNRRIVFYVKAPRKSY